MLYLKKFGRILVIFCVVYLLITVVSVVDFLITKDIMRGTSLVAQVINVIILVSGLIYLFKQKPIETPAEVMIKNKLKKETWLLWVLGPILVAIILYGFYLTIQ